MQLLVCKPRIDSDNALQATHYAAKSTHIQPDAAKESYLSSHALVVLRMTNCSGYFVDKLPKLPDLCFVQIFKVFVAKLFAFEIDG